MGDGGSFRAAFPDGDNLIDIHFARRGNVAAKLCKKRLLQKQLQLLPLQLPKKNLKLISQVIW